MEGSLSEPSRRVKALLERIAAEVAVGEAVTVTVTEEPDALVARYSGDDLGVLIGHHGQTIDAISHLAYRIAFQGSESRRRVEVDAAGYRDRRAMALRAAADQAAEAAVHDGRPVALDAMSALERRLVHEHLKSRRDVETYSEGEEPSRRLVVAPVVG